MRSPWVLGESQSGTHVLLSTARIMPFLMQNCEQWKHTYPREPLFPCITFKIIKCLILWWSTSWNSLGLWGVIRDTLIPVSFWCNQRWLLYSLFAWIHGLDYKGLEVNMLSSDRNENSSGDYDLINLIWKQFILKLVVFCFGLVFLIWKLINKHVVAASKRQRT